MMKPSTDDQTTGKIHEVKGTIKEKVGELTNNPDMEADGNAEKNAGKVQNWIGKVEKSVGQ
ncbi:MAG: CsbD family protein [Candidatus Korobacteraceae bacterium]